MYTREACIFCFEVKHSDITIKSIWFSVSFKTAVSMLIFCLRGQSIGINVQVCYYEYITVSLNVSQ